MLSGLGIASMAWIAGCNTPEEETDTDTADCYVEAFADPMSYQFEWEHRVETLNEVFSEPAIGSLTDDNANGKIDPYDIPDIAFTTWPANTLTALSGDGSGVLFTLSGIEGRGGVSIADIDDDGVPELLALNDHFEVVALDLEGNVKWSSDQHFYTARRISTADLDGNGSIEVIVDGAILDGKTGSNIAYTTISGTLRAPVLRDLDGDGSLEILMYGQVWSHTGEVEWNAAVRSWDSNYASVANIDGDSGLETVFAAGQSKDSEKATILIHDHDGALLDSFNVDGKRTGIPELADFDGDGQIEIALSTPVQLTVLELDGSVVWQIPKDDTIGRLGGTAHDFDGDGQSELVHADYEGLRIYDGATGEVLFHDWNLVYAGLSFTRPLVTDLDRDGDFELVATVNQRFVVDFEGNQETDAGVTILGPTGNGWFPCDD